MAGIGFGKKRRATRRVADLKDKLSTTKKRVELNKESGRKNNASRLETKADRTSNRLARNEKRVKKASSPKTKLTVGGRRKANMTGKEKLDKNHPAISDAAKGISQAAKYVKKKVKGFRDGGCVGGKKRY